VPRRLTHNDGAGATTAAGSGPRLAAAAVGFTSGLGERVEELSLLRSGGSVPCRIRDGPVLGWSCGFGAAFLNADLYFELRI